MLTTAHVAPTRSSTRKAPSFKRSREDCQTTLHSSLNCRFPQLLERTNFGLIESRPRNDRRRHQSFSVGDKLPTETQQSKAATQQHSNAATQQRSNAATQQRSNAATQHTATRQHSTQQHSIAASQQRSNAASQQRNATQRSKAKQRSNTATQQHSKTATQQHSNAKVTAETSATR